MRPTSSATRIRSACLQRLPTWGLRKQTSRARRSSGLTLSTWDTSRAWNRSNSHRHHNRRFNREECVMPERRSRRLVKIVGMVVCTLVIINALTLVTVYTRTVSTCILCRIERTDRTLLGHSWSTVRDTSFTKWYHEHRPEHQHLWSRLNCTRGYSVFGTTTYWACGPRHPACDLSSEQMVQFVNHTDARTLARFFDGIVSDDPGAQREVVDMAWQELRESE